MQVSRRAAKIGAAVLTGLASPGAAGARSASSAAPATHNQVQVLRLHTVFVSLAVNHAGMGAWFVTEPSGFKDLGRALTAGYSPFHAAYGAAGIPEVGKLAQNV